MLHFLACNKYIIYNALCYYGVECANEINMMPQQFLIVASKETTNYYCMHTSMTQTLDGFKLINLSITHWFRSVSDIELRLISCRNSRTGGHFTLFLD